MSIIDLTQQQLRYLYQASSTEVEEVDIPALRVLALEGSGSPGSQQHVEACAVLLSLSYTIKFLLEQQHAGLEYNVMPLEGLWWSGDGSDWHEASDENRFWKLLMVQPQGVSEAMLEQIAQVLDEGLSPEELLGMARLKRAEIQQRLGQEQERLLRIDTWMRQIAMEQSTLEYDVLVKTVEPPQIASIRDIVPTYQHVAELLNELYAYLQSYGVGGLAGAIVHDEEYKPRNVDIEGVVYLLERVPASERVRVYDLPAAMTASVVHHGSFNSVSLAYTAAMGWIEANGYRIAGPNRELYLSCPMPLRQDDETYVVELQFPIEQM